MESVIIEFNVDVSKLVPTIQILKQLGQITEEQSNEFEKLTAEGNKAFELLRKNSQSTLPSFQKLEQGVISTGKAVDQALLMQLKKLNTETTRTVKGMAAVENSLSGGVNDALREAGVTTEQFQKGLQDAGISAEEFSALMVGAITNSQEFSDALEIADIKTKSLKGQLRTLKEQLSAMETAGMEGSAMFQEMAVEAAKLEDQIGDTAERIRGMSSDTYNIDAAVEGIQFLSGAMQTAAGAAALMGVGEEDLQKVMIKLNAVMAVSQGIQQVVQTLKGKSALITKAETAATLINTTATRLTAAAYAGLGVSVTATSIAFKVLRGALIATGIGAIVVLIGSLVSMVDNWKSSSETAADAQQRLADQTEAFTKAVNDQIEALDYDNQLIQKRSQLQGKSEKEITDLQRKAIQDRIDLRNNEMVKATNQGLAITELAKENSKDIQALTLFDLNNQIEARNKNIQDAKNAMGKLKAMREKAAEEEKGLVEAKTKANLDIEKENLQDFANLNKEVADNESLNYELRSNSAKAYIETLKTLADNEETNARNNAKTNAEVQLAEQRKARAIAKINTEGATLNYNIWKANEEKRVELLQAPDVPDATKEQMEAQFKLISDGLAKQNEELDNISKKKLETLKQSIEFANGFIKSSLGDSPVANILTDALSTYQQLAELDAKFKAGEITAQQEHEAKKKAIILAAVSVTQEAVNAIYANQAANRQAELSASLDRLNIQKEAELNTKNITEQQKDDINRRYAAKERKLKLQAFEEDKKAKRTQALIAGALGIVQAFATAPWPVSIVFAGIVAATTAIQIANINKQKPGFKKGTRNAPRGYAWVGEEGAELVYLNGGEKIYTYNQSKKVAAGWEAGAHKTPDQILSGFTVPDAVPADILNYNSSANLSIDYDELGKAVARNIKIPEPKVVQNNMDADGFTSYIIEGISKAEIKNKRHST